MDNYEDDSLIALYESERKWNRARRRVLVQKIVGAFKNCSVDLIPFEEVRTRLHLTHHVYRGIQDVEIARIRGSVGRYRDFTSAFLPRRRHLRERWERINRMVSAPGMPTMPPIEVYRVGDAYFVLDGNHRVSNARQEGIKTIAAHVCEYMTPIGLSAEADLDEVIVKSELTEFLNNTHFDRLRPGQEIAFTTPGHYREIECLITMYKEALEENRGGAVRYVDALVMWYDLVYIPAVHEIKNSGVLGRFPGRTEADLFIWMWKNRQKLLKRCTPNPVLGAVDTVFSLSKRVWQKASSALFKTTS